ncbi:MAG: restriction endonuclease subunit S [Thiobacillus sp.]
MRSEWRDCTLGEFVRLQRGHDLTASEQQPGTVPVMGSAGPNGTHAEARAKGPGVVIGRSGASIGRVHYSAVDYWPHNTCLYVTDFLGNHPRFAYYLLQTLDLAGYNSGSAQPSLNRNYIYGMKVRAPDRDEQERIVETLQALDDRIDLLRQTNATLESIAQALFKSWFIDFDPVRAKQAGREPEGMDAATAALFPAEFEESALGLIPKGWQAGCLGDVLTQRVSRTKPSEATATLPYVPIECITAKSVFLQESLPGTQAQSSLTFFKEGDILFGAMRPYFHKVCIAPFDGVTRTTAFVLQSKAKHGAFALFAAFDDSTIEFATTHSEGSTIPYAKWSGSLERKPLVLPPSELAAAFEVVVAPLLRSGIHAMRRAQTLTDVRDELLPRLLSGKLRLPEAQEQLEDALA